MCSHRALPLCDHPVTRRMLEYAEKRAIGSLTKDEQASVRAESSALYDALYPGYGSPTAEVLALSAIGEAVFTVDPLTATINVVLFVADAIATAAGTKADPNDYDAAYEAAYLTECEAELALLEQLIV